MELRLALYQLAAQEGLSPPGIQRLLALAGLEGEPASLRRRLPRGVALLAAVLGGLAVVFWIAAHWGSLGRAGQFALLQGLLVAAALGAWRFPVARVPLALLAWLDLGGLLAFFGQTYQTGADPWQLFALWALLSLPLALAVRSDALWLPWALVALTGVALWMQTFTLQGGWWSPPTDTGVYLAGWSIGAALVAGFVPAMRRWTGAGPWALRGACLLWVVLIAGTALDTMMGRDVTSPLWQGAFIMAVTAVLMARVPRPDIHVLSVVVLALDSLLLGGLAHEMFGGYDRGEWLELKLATLSLAALGLLAGTIQGLMHLVRHSREEA